MVVKYEYGSAFHCGFVLIVAVFMSFVVGDVPFERSGDDDNVDDDDDGDSSSSSSSGCCSW